MAEEKRIVLHWGQPLGSADYDLEDAYHSRLNKILAVSDLFCVTSGSESERYISEKGSNGLSRLLESNVEDLRTICEWMLERIDR